MGEDMTIDEYRAEGEKLFGDDMAKWKFVCPACGSVMSTTDYKNAGAPHGAVGFSCVGRWLREKREAIGGRGNGPCNYAGGGLFQLGPIDVDGKKMFDFYRGQEAEK